MSKSSVDWTAGNHRLHQDCVAFGLKHEDMFSPDWKQCFVVQVLPASLNAEATSFSGPGLQNAIAGSPAYLTVAPRDAYGNVCSKGPVELQASAMLLPADAVLPNKRATLPVNIANNLDGSFLLSVTSEQVNLLSHTDD